MVLNLLNGGLVKDVIYIVIFGGDADVFVKPFVMVIFLVVEFPEHVRLIVSVPFTPLHVSAFPVGIVIC